MIHELRGEHLIGHRDGFRFGVDLRSIGERGAQLFVDQAGILDVIISETGEAERGPQREENEQGLPHRAEKKAYRPGPWSYFQSCGLPFGCYDCIFPQPRGSIAAWLLAASIARIEMQVDRIHRKIY